MKVPFRCLAPWPTTTQPPSVLRDKSRALSASISRFGPGFQIDGHVIEWQKWRFHLRSDRRVGAVISTVTYNTGERRRQVLYQGSLSEIFVPYMDPAFRVVLSKLPRCGANSTRAVRPSPCSRVWTARSEAVYLDGLVAADDGRPRTVSERLCLFERGGRRRGLATFSRRA